MPRGVRLSLSNCISVQGSDLKPICLLLSPFAITDREKLVIEEQVRNHEHVGQSKKYSQKSGFS